MIFFKRFLIKSADRKVIFERTEQTCRVRAFRSQINFRFLYHLYLNSTLPHDTPLENITYDVDYSYQLFAFEKTIRIIFSQ